MTKKILILIVTLMLLAIAGNVFAIEEPDPRGAYFTTLNQVADSIQSKSLMTEMDVQTLNSTMESLAEKIKASFDAAVESTRASAADNGGRCCTDKLGKEEALLKTYESQMNSFNTKAQAIASKLKAGSIMLDQALLSKMSTSDWTGFKSSLVPGVFEKYQNLYKDCCFDKLQIPAPSKTPIMPRTIKPGVFLNQPEMNQFVSAVGEFCSSLPKNLSNFFVSPAEAMVAAQCVLPCGSKQWSACLTCCQSASSSALSAYSTFKSCWNGYSSLKWWDKATCLKNFISNL